MPELPEVEAVSQALNKLVAGRTIVSASLIRPRLAPDIEPRVFARELRSRRILSVGRRGKQILFDLSGGSTLIVHLRMSGQFSLITADTIEPKFTHAIFDLDDDARLVFHDQRHFGLMKIVESRALGETKEIKNLAPEPLSDEFSVEYLRSRMAASRRSVKEFLLDQTKVCGLGNIYAAEALFLAGLRPTLVARRVKKRSIVLLHAAIRDVLRIAIAHAEDLPVDPADLEGRYFSGKGEGWAVYDREGQPCRRCETPILRTKQGGRSTYFCKKCQRT